VGTALPATLTPETEHAQGGVSTRYRASWGEKRNPAELPARSWKSWLVTTDETATYVLTLHASGGPVGLRIDDAEATTRAAMAGGGTLRLRVELTPGVHAIKVQSGSEALTIEKITAEKD
jgi:hypothetical protein